VGVKAHPTGQLLETLALVHLLLIIVPTIVGQTIGQLVGGVVLEHIEDKPLLNSLLHTVDMKGFRDAGCPRSSKKLDGLGFGCGGEGKKAHILRLFAGVHSRHQHVFGADLLAFGNLLGGEHPLEHPRVGSSICGRYQHIGLADGEGFRVEFLAKEHQPGLLVHLRDVLIGNAEHPARAAGGIVETAHHPWG
jgi:hypothetical protein